LRETVETTTRFLDDVVDANAYVPALPELREAALRARRIGLGIMGLADALYAMGYAYNSPEGREMAARIMEFVRYHCMRTSVELAKERGAFPAIEGSVYDPDDFRWQPPAEGGMDWAGLMTDIKAHGIRNAEQTTIAPTGTLSTVSGVEGYGCEPVFALAYTRWLQDGDTRRELHYMSPLFEQALIDAGISEAERGRIAAEVARTGSCQGVDGVPAEIQRVFVVSSDISPKDHVLMQAALQQHVGNALSKTINFPATATPDDVATAYMLAWRTGCKGITVYVAGSREKVVLETAATKKQAPPAAPDMGEKLAEAVIKGLSMADVEPRPRSLRGSTHRIETPLGKAYVTVNRDDDGEPFEVFANVGKAGSDIASVSEAIGRLISLILRMPSPMSPTSRLEEVQRQLSGIGGSRSLGFGLRRVRSLADGIALALGEALGQQRPEAEAQLSYASGQASPATPRQPQGDLCPECGQATLVHEEGCMKCYSCAHSAC
jgi:ribonucleoside-diphosphate reductase alpha chain